MGVIEGLAIPWGQRSRCAIDRAGHAEIFRRGAFRETVARARAGIDTVNARYQHGGYWLGSTAGRGLDLWEDEEGLKFVLESPHLGWGEIARVREGRMQVSVDFHAVVAGLAGGVRRVECGHLLEICLVPQGAYRTWTKFHNTLPPANVALRARMATAMRIRGIGI